MGSTARSIFELAGRHAPGLWAFAVVAAYVPFIPSGATYGRHAAMALGVAALLWRSRVVPSAGHLMLGGLLGWMACGFLWTTSAWETGGEIVFWSILAGCFCVGFSFSDEDVDDLWKGFGAGMVVSACFAIGQKFGMESLGLKPSWFSSDDPVWSIYDKTIWSIYPVGQVGIFLSKNMASDAAVLALIGCCAWSRIVFIPAAAVSMWLVGGRAGAMALGAAGFAGLWFSFPGRRPGLAAVAAAAAVIVLLLAHLGLLGQFSDRLQIWELVARNLTILGHGAGTFAVAATGIEHAHNEFLHYAFELGIGSVLLWGIFAHALGSGPVLERCALVAILAQSVVWFPLHAPVPAFLGMVLAGRLCGLRDRAAGLERARGMACSLGLFDGDALGVGAMSEADHLRLRSDGRSGADLRATAVGRRDLPAGPADQVGTGAVRGAVSGSRTEA